MTVTNHDHPGGATSGCYTPRRVAGVGPNQTVTPGPNQARTASPKGGQTSWGTCFVVAGIVVTLPMCDRPVCLPVLARLWRPKGTPKTVLACQMIAAIAARVPDRAVHLVADAHYAGADGAPLRQGRRERGMPDGVTLTSRLRVNAVLHAIATPIPGRGGRPRRIGPRLGTPAELAATLTWRQASVRRYGRVDQILVAELTCLWYGTYRSRAVRVKS